VKENIRTIGIDDAAFNRSKSTKTFVFGVIVRGYNLVEAVLRTEILIDGIEATKRITSMIVKSKYHEQLRAIFLRSSTIAAFNIIDMNMLSKVTSIPVITVLSEIPDENDVKKALSNLPDWDFRLDILNRNPPIEKVKYTNREGRDCEVLIQQVGLSDKSNINKILQISSYSSCIPESLRLADKIGKSFKDYTIN